MIDIANFLRALAQNDYMVNEHYTSEGVALIQAADAFVDLNKRAQNLAQTMKRAQSIAWRQGTEAARSEDKPINPYGNPPLRAYRKLIKAYPPRKTKTKELQDA